MSASTTTTTWPAVKVTATHLAALQLAPSSRAALVQHRDGSLDVIPDLRDEPIPATSRTVRSADQRAELNDRQWADELVEAERDAARGRGVPMPPLGTLRKLAGIEATAELAAAARAAAPAVIEPAAVVPTPPVSPVPALLVPRPRRAGRHVAPLSPQAAQAEEEQRWAFVLDVLEAMDDAA